MSEKKWGTIELSGKDILVPDTSFDRIATSGRGELLLLSLVAPSQIVKQIRAVLHATGRTKIVGAGVKVKKPSASAFYAQQPGNLFPSSDGYSTYIHKLDYGMAHALIVTKAPGFIKVVSDETIWQELTDIRFTTPVLRSWVPYITKEMSRLEILEEANCYNCNCAYMTATTKGLDEIVTGGLQSGGILIPSKMSA